MADSRDLYQDGVDFAALAIKSREFNEHLRPDGRIDFKDPAAVQALTKALLQQDFGISIEIPNDRLWPPVKNRLNYIHWIQDLLDSTRDDFQERPERDRSVVLLDIGTGASCIYPLLGCRLRSNWNFLATDIDERSLECARLNVGRNDLGDRVRVLARTGQKDEPLIPLDESRIERIDATMCNPPFYESFDEVDRSRAMKQADPSAACSGSENEMITPGGELQFAKRMVAESLILRERVRWYTTMFGKLSSLESLVQTLKGHEITNIAVTEFVQGRTRRWAVGWSFQGFRPPPSSARIHGANLLEALPFPAEQSWNLEMSVLTVGSRVDECLKPLSLECTWESEASYLLRCTGNVWSRAARRKQQRTVIEDVVHIEEDKPIQLVARIFITEGQNPKGSVLKIRWLYGSEAVLFESFCGMLKRKITEQG